MRKTRHIRTNKVYDVYVNFKKPTTEDKFKRSLLYKNIKKFISDNEFILYYEDYQSDFDPVTDAEYDIEYDPDFYWFSFLRKKHAVAVSKKFDLQLLEHSRGNDWIFWPECNVPGDPGDPGNSYMPDGMSFDECMEIYGDIPGSR